MSQMPAKIFSEEQLLEISNLGQTTWHTQRGEIPVTQEDIDTVMAMDMHKVINDIPQNVPILVVHGTDDELIGDE